MSKNNPFKIVVAVIIVIVGISIYAGVNGQLATLPQNIMGAITVPIKQAAASISNKISLLQNKYIDIDKVIQENEDLKNELAELKSKQVDYDKIKIENQEYEKFLEIKKENPEYETVAAAVIGRDGQDKFNSFTIDQGENAGIEKNDVVLTSEGVVGVIVEAGPNFSRVSTILSPSVSIASFASSTRDTGVVMGSSEYADKQECVLKYLPNDTLAKTGDLVSTTGLGGIFPKDLIVGEIKQILTEPSGNSKYAVVTPVADIVGARMVFVITNY